MNIAASIALWAKSNWKGILIAAVLASAALWGAFQHRQAGKYRAGLERAQTALVAASVALENASRIRIADDEATKAKIIYIDRINEKEAVGREATTKALEANSAWRDTPVPADVLDSLRD